MQKHYIIGDVHGEYQTLLALVEKLPKDAKLIFVGDLIDRGLQSREVVEYVRRHNHLTVMGNHELLMIEYIKESKLQFISDINIDTDNIWVRNGGLNTLLSYGLLGKTGDGSYQIIKDTEAIEQLKDDVAWMEKLPIYLELEANHSSGKKVVVSHSNISKVWTIRNDKEKQQKFIDEALWTRDQNSSDKANIFNIYGHTPQKYNAQIGNNFANIDTGCYFSSSEDNMYGQLSAYCVESGEIFEVRKILSRVR